MCSEFHGSYLPMHSSSQPISVETTVERLSHYKERACFCQLKIKNRYAIETARNLQVLMRVTGLAVSIPICAIDAFRSR